VFLERCYELTKPLPPIFDGNISSVLNSVTVPKSPSSEPPSPPECVEENGDMVDNLPEVNNPKEEVEVDEKIASKSGKPKNYINLSEFLTLPQNDAAKILKMATSSLSKKWKEASNSRKWPYRTIQKIDKEIMTLLNNVSPYQPLDPVLECNLGKLLRRRQQELRPVLITK